MKSVRMYEPWGYREQNKYQSEKEVILNFSEDFFADVKYKNVDKKIHFYNVYGNETCTIDVSEFPAPDIVNTTYDSETKSLTIEFDNGTTTKIDLTGVINDISVPLTLKIDEETNRAVSVELILQQMIEAIADELASVSDNSISKVTYEWNQEDNTMSLRLFNVNDELKTSVGLFDTDDNGEVLLTAGDF